MGLSFPQLLVETLETIDAFFQQARVGDVAPGPTGEDGIDPEAFRALKFSVFEIGVVYHFRDFQNRFVGNAEALHECFEGAVVAVMRELDVGHVEGQGVWIF